MSVFSFIGLAVGIGVPFSQIFLIMCQRPHIHVSLPLAVNQAAKEDTMVMKVGSVSMAPQADNPLGRSVLRKDIYQ